MNNIKLYLFNSTEAWETKHAAGIIAATREEADRIYRLKQGANDDAYTIEEVALANGLHIQVYGFDSLGISAGL